MSSEPSIGVRRGVVVDQRRRPGQQRLHPADRAPMRGSSPGRAPGRAATRPAGGSRRTCAAARGGRACRARAPSTGGCGRRRCPGTIRQPEQSSRATPTERCPRRRWRPGRASMRTSVGRPTAGRATDDRPAGRSVMARLRGTAATPPRAAVADRGRGRAVGAAARAAAESRIGRRVRRTPSNACSAPATAAAVGTRTASPAPFAPYGPSGCGSSIRMRLDRRHAGGRDDPERLDGLGHRHAVLDGRYDFGQGVAEAHVDAALASGPRGSAG